MIGWWQGAKIVRFWRKGEQRVGSAGVLARNNVPCKRLMRSLPLETKPRIGISISLSQSGRGRPRSRLRIHEPRTKLACPLSLTDYH
jgi:hypothetical protein